MTVKEITNKIKHILEELSYSSAVAYLTLNDKKWLKAAIKALEQEPCEDAVSRQAVLDKILKFSVTDGRSVSVAGLWTEVNELPLVTPQEPCDVPDINVGDMISRQAVLDLAQKGVLISNGSYKSVCKAINDLPSVTPQPKMGKWIKSRDCYGNNHFTCPFCENDIATKYDGAWKDNYCSNCGARMQEVE